jgi:hypothetical protein
MSVKSNCYSIIKDRNTYIIKVNTKKAEADIIQELEKVKKSETDIFLIPDEVVYNFGDSYISYIKQKFSLKDYLSGNILSVNNMLFITRKIEEIITLSKEINITLDDICFDYGGIFIDPSFTKISFLQLPYSGQNKQNGILDLYKLLSLNMDWENNKSIDLTVTEILQIISEWENAEDEKIVNEYQLERIKTILITYEKDKDRFANLFKFGQDLLSGRSKSNNKLILFGNNLLNGIDTEIKGRLLKIGRDNNWADIGINNLIIGRKHAEVYIDNGKYFIKDLNSVNGTYINKMRINSLEKIKIGINDVIGFGDPGGYSVILKDEKSTLKEKFKKFGKMYKC